MPVAGHSSPIAQQRWIECQNVDTVEVPAWGVMMVTESTNPKAGRNVLSVKRPDTTNGIAGLATFVLNGPTALAASAFGVCTLDSPAFAVYNTAATPAVGETWGPKPDQFTLEQDYPGFRILGGNTGSGATSRTRVAIEEVNSLHGVLVDALAEGAEATVSIWADASGSEADTTVDMEARDRFMKSGATDIAVGKKVAMTRISGTWYVTTAECP
ncbi:hypothetical protein [uncultured Mediterranean phage uvDeep-CGR2-KM19-C37]|nr:hypothetical protein [uncultured Mediterranean phage uvDeep-CGR2-KM19-C37]